MSVLVNEYRGGVLEIEHHGRICVVDAAGSLLHSVGDPEAPTFFRSSSKPFQALPVLALGLAAKYGFNDREIAIMAGSNAGEDIHLETILSMLQKASLSEDDLIMNPAWPARACDREAMLLNGMKPRKALHNCAGKHIGAMLLARHLTGDARNYWQPDSAAQREILRCVAYLSGVPADSVKIGIDGCGVPVFAVPQRGIAAAFAKLACPDTIGDSGLRAAAQTMVAAIHRNPLMMRGTGFLCSVFNEDENVVAKGGAQGVYGFGLVRERLGVSLKLEDGTGETWPLVIAEILRKLAYPNAETLAKLDALRPREIRNDNKSVVGEMRPVFSF